jgi:hypothetical protein
VSGQLVLWIYTAPAVVTDELTPSK